MPIEVTVKWDDKNAIDILRNKVEEAMDILKSMLNKDASKEFDGDVDEL